ncbi:HAMP domain-containing sensor histidine kinase [Paludibacterium purpuratum]|uniref:histidine kinase n=1 Tax=Paludibacterium purpuratum TaxID=1144873 RepID=A0A4R7B589_9NEIS|nr:ATP-binding protein [Paludibacterium purpuratum]TDR79778.1 signal transduction histidine kinase [Paludibacterium purpuratum]
MRRLFGKFILAFWLAFAAISLTVAGTAWLIRHEHAQWLEASRPPPPIGEPIAALIEAGQLDSVRILLSAQSSHRGPHWRVLDQRGMLLAGPSGERTVRREQSVTDRQGHRYRLQWLAPVDNGEPHPPGPPPAPWLMIVIALLASLSFSAGLAWYMVGPVRVLRQALRAVSSGQLDTRIGDRMGRRRDELADLAADFDAMATQLERQMSAQQRLLHDVSHELRSPLARLQAAIGLIRQNPARLTDTLARIERETQRLDVLVDEVLTLARLEGRVRQPATTVDLIELLTQIVDDAEFEAQATGCTIRLDAPGEFVLTCQATLLYRCFENVIRNAVKFSPAGATIEVSAWRADGGLHVSVRDHGPGVTRDDLAAIFEPFYRTSARTEDGYGLGLAIARRAIESHGGQIAARLPDDGGLLIELSLPGGA